MTAPMLHRRLLTPAQEVARAARPVLAALVPGQTTIIALPDNKLCHRSAREALIAECHKTLGAGAYSVITRNQGGNARITRKAIA